MDLEVPVFAAETDPSDPHAPRPVQIQGKDNLTVSIASDVLQQARRLKGQLQISQVVEQALADKIKEIQYPHKAELLKRLRAEREERRGPLYRLGSEEGRRWASDIASWAEIKQYAQLKSADVVMADPDDHNWFAGPFDMPWDDYPNFRPLDDEDEPVTQASMAQWARGWLAGVRAIFELVKEDMETVDPDDIPF